MGGSGRVTSLGMPALKSREALEAEIKAKEAGGKTGALSPETPPALAAEAPAAAAELFVEVDVAAQRLGFIVIDAEPGAVQDAQMQVWNSQPGMRVFDTRAVKTASDTLLGIHPDLDPNFDPRVHQGPSIIIDPIIYGAKSGESVPIDDGSTIDATSVIGRARSGAARADTAPRLGSPLESLAQNRAQIDARGSITPAQATILRQYVSMSDGIYQAGPFMISVKTVRQDDQNFRTISLFDGAQMKFVDNWEGLNLELIFARAEKIED